MIADLVTLPIAVAAKPAAAAEQATIGDSGDIADRGMAFQAALAAVATIPAGSLTEAAPALAQKPAQMVAIPAAAAATLPVIGRILPASGPVAHLAAPGRSRRIPIDDAAPADSVGAVVADPPPSLVPPAVGALQAVNNPAAAWLTSAPPLTQTLPPAATGQTRRAIADLPNPLTASLSPNPIMVSSAADAPADAANALAAKPPFIAAIAPVGATAMAFASTGPRSSRPGAALVSDDSFSAALADIVPASPSLGTVLVMAPGALGQAVVPTPAASVAMAAPQDFATLVERLVDARAAASHADAPQLVTAAVTHREFGKVSIDFVQDNAGLVVNMTSADPGFARSAQTALAGIAPAGAGNAMADNPAGQGDSPQHGAASADAGLFGQTNAHSAGNGAATNSPSSQSQAQRRPTIRVAARTAAAVAGAAADQGSGIYA